MSYSMTYDSLLQDVRRYLERGFTAESDAIVYEQLPRLITLGERRIARELKIEGFIRAVQTPLQVGLAVYLKPDRWRDTVSMSINNVPIFARSYEYIRNYWPDESETGTPEFYADYDYQHWIIAPTPAAAQTWEILYYEQPAFLGEDFQTNWLTEYLGRVVQVCHGRVVHWRGLWFLLLPSDHGRWNNLHHRDRCIGTPVSTFGSILGFRYGPGRSLCHW